MPSKGGLIYHLTCLLYVPYLGKLWDPQKIMNLASSCRYPLWFHCCVENGYDWVDLCHPCNESQRPVLPRCLILSADAASHQASCKRYICLSTRQRSISSCKDTIKHLQQDTGLNWSWSLATKQPKLSNYKVWGVMQQRVYECRMNSVDELKRRLIEVLKSGTVCSRTLLTQPSTSGESDWERACMKMDNILNIYCERVWLTKVMDK